MANKQFKHLFNATPEERTEMAINEFIDRFKNGTFEEAVEELKEHDCYLEEFMNRTKTYTIEGLIRNYPNQSFLKHLTFFYKSDASDDECTKLAMEYAKVRTIIISTIIEKLPKNESYETKANKLKTLETRFIILKKDGNGLAAKKYLLDQQIAELEAKDKELVDILEGNIKKEKPGKDNNNEEAEDKEILEKMKKIEKLKKSISKHQAILDDEDYGDEDEDEEDND